MQKKNKTLHNIFEHLILTFNKNISHFPVLLSQYFST